MIHYDMWSYAASKEAMDRLRLIERRVVVFIAASDYNETTEDAQIINQ